MFKVLAIRAFGAVATFGIGVLLARYLEASNYGNYAFMIGIALFIATVGQLGTGMAVVKLRLSGDAVSDGETIGYYVWHAAVSFVTIVAIAALVAVFPGSDERLEFVGLAATALAAFGTLFIVNIYQSVKRSDLAVLPSMVLIPCGLAIVITVLGINETHAALWAFVGVASVSALVLTALFLRYFSGVRAIVTPVIRWWNWSNLASGFLVAQLGHAILFIQLPVVVGFVVAPAEFGHFSVAYKLAAAQLVAFNAIGIYATPYFADRAVLQDRAQVDQLLIRLIVVSFALALPLFIAMVVVPKLLISSLYGPEYVRAAELLPILSVGIFVHAGSGPWGNFLLMNNAVRYYNYTSLGAGVLGIGAVLAAGAVHGAIAAAWCVALTMALWKCLIILKGGLLYLSMNKNDAARPVAPPLSM